jgi:hypothetical protein
MIGQSVRTRRSGCAVARSLSSAQRTRFQLRRPSDSESGVCCKPELAGSQRSPARNDPRAKPAKPNAPSPSAPLPSSASVDKAARLNLTSYRRRPAGDNGKTRQPRSETTSSRSVATVRQTVRVARHARDEPADPVVAAVEKTARNKLPARKRVGCRGTMVRTAAARLGTRCTSGTTASETNSSEQDRKRA